MQHHIMDACKVGAEESASKIYLLGHDEIPFAEAEQNMIDGYAIVDPSGRTLQFFEDYFDAECAKCKLDGGIAIGPEFIAIYDEGEELGYWSEEEWLEDPRLTVNLANAIRLYYTKGPGYIRELISQSHT